MRPKSKAEIFVGLSGGVDSSVSAALLKEAGYDVTGVFIKVWQPEWLECTWREDRRDAMRVAATLDIPFVTLDLEKEYKEEVIDYLIAEYRAGRTPNPDVMCNKAIKFGAFYDWAIGQRADFIATGHYARIKKSSLRDAEAPVNVTCSLLAGSDTNKDQSYFLWNLKQEQLPHILFPVGGMNKSEVRKLAVKFKLPTAAKKDSQGLCFIGKVDFKGFLAHYLKNEPGDVLNETGEIIGRHEGAVFATIGERHGFTITEKGTRDAPYYVTGKDIDQNTITVSHRDPAGGLPGATRRARINAVNWISGNPPLIGPANDFNLLARARYRQTLAPIRIASVNFSETAVEFENPQDTLTSGQSLVIYDGGVCLGGGVIE